MTDRNGNGDPDVSQAPETAPARPRLGYRVTRSLFLRGMGVVYLIAFASFGSQAMGLIGSDGILPVADFLGRAAEQLGAERFWKLPTVFWLNASDAAIHLVCGLGCAAAVALIAGLAPLPMMVILWIGYLSLASAGRAFTGYQWDALLLEAGLLAIFACPWALRPRLAWPGEPSRLVVWLHRWLVFRLMFMSGAVKLASGDTTWREMTALAHHFETQPLPNVLGWWAHQAPDWFLVGATGGTLFLELIVPFCALGPRAMRLAGFFGLAGLQVLILLTGSYGFFNLLTLLLCLWLLDDGRLLRLAPRRWAERTSAAEPSGTRADRLRRGLAAAPLAAVIALGSVYHLGNLVGRWIGDPVAWPSAITRPMGILSPFRAVNSYGLFANMTTRRPEIVVQGSRDGRDWKTYRFAYKPGDPSRRPVQAAPHQPRLDWQMWFEALHADRMRRSTPAARPRPNPWFVRFLRQLLRDSEPVTGMLRHNPFPDKPPRYIRAVLHDYRCADPQTLSATGAWWRREAQSAYVPAIRLRDQ